MRLPDPAALRQRAAEACESGAMSPAVERAACKLLAALDRAPSLEIALLDVFAEMMEAISETYFGQSWANEHEYSLFARLRDDRRAWGYGAEDEIGPLRWLHEVSGTWYDGKRLRAGEDWEAAYEDWAGGQEAMVRRQTPGALTPPPFPPEGR